MSTFGDGSLRQQVLDGLMSFIPENTPPEKLIAAVIAVAAYLAAEHAKIAPGDDF